MSVLFINNTVETFTPTQSGAVATHIWECCRAAAEESLAPVVLSIRCEASAYQDVQTVLLEYPRVPTSYIGFKLVRAQRKLTGWRYVRQGKYARRVVEAIRREGLQDRPMILHNDPEMAVFLREHFPKAFLIHHFHNPIETDAPFRRRFGAAVNVTTAVSNFISRWAEAYFGISSVRTIYNGVDGERFRPAQTKDSAVPVINFVGRTGMEKAPDLLLKAAAKLAETNTRFSLQILGSNHWQKFVLDDYQRELQRLAADLESKGILVRRPGHVGREAMPAELQKADIHVVPSRWDEPCALTIFEGMSTGLPIVASRTGGTPEIIGEAGFLFERDSVEGLADHLRKLVEDEKLRTEFSKKARARAQEFTWRKTWQGYREAAGI